jgi:hypothetical protein
MSRELSPEARALIERLAAAKQDQRGDHMQALEVLERARDFLAELGRATSPTALPGPYKARGDVQMHAQSLLKAIGKLQRELDPP